MTRTTTLVGITAGLIGAGFTYSFMSKDTISYGGVPNNFVANSNCLNPTQIISSKHKTKYEFVIKKCQELAERFKDEIGIPGLVVGVSVNGDIIWEEGFGYANLETRTLCNANTKMRIASISKALTMTLLAKLWESNKIDLDKSIYEYVPYFPKKKVDGEEVDITIRQLASHTAGIRHYKKKGEKKDKDNRDSGSEFYFKEKCDDIKKSIAMFQDDELLFKPGTSFEYTTHGYTLLSAAIESVGGKSFTEQILHFFRTLGLHNTQLDYNQKIIYGRASYYDKNKQGHIINAELADTSYKWAGGGFISTVGDIIKFGNCMLYCYQQNNSDKPGFLKKETILEMWTPMKISTMKWGQSAGYGLGWTVVPKIDDVGGLTETQKFYVGHSGGAVGASSVLIILPKQTTIFSDENKNEIKEEPPLGITVAVLVNLENVSCRTLGKTIAEEFYKSAYF